MSMCVLGMAAEFADKGIAVNALWPRTAIATAAVQNHLGGDEIMRLSRIAYWLLPAKYYNRFQLLILGYRLLSKNHSYLVKRSFADSILKKGLPENHNRIIPWMCYPIIDFLKDRLTAKLNVFEYGSGFSTIFFANRVNTINSVEHDKVWLNKLNNALSKYENASVYFVEDEKRYPESILTADMNKKYDVVVVDGIMRVECVKISFDFLSPQGIIILDDSGRPEYEPAFTFLAEKGYRYISFSGMKPGMLRQSQSTIFYKSGNNCYNI